MLDAGRLSIESCRRNPQIAQIDTDDIESPHRETADFPYGAQRRLAWK